MLLLLLSNLVWIQCWLCFEQKVGLGTSWSPFEAELSYNRPWFFGMVLPMGRSGRRLPQCCSGLDELMSRSSWWHADNGAAVHGSVTVRALLRYNPYWWVSQETYNIIIWGLLNLRAKLMENYYLVMTMRVTSWDEHLLFGLRKQVAVALLPFLHHIRQERGTRKIVSQKCP